MTRLPKILLTLLAVAASATLALIVYWIYARLAYRDLPAAELERRYGDGQLKTALIDGVRLYYRLQGSGPTIVLIHSHFLEMGMWEAWMPALASHFQVLRYDLSGHGLTGPDPSGVYTVDRDVQILNQLLDRLQLRRIHLVGSSLGGNIAFTYAARFPDRVDSLVLINSGGLPRKDRRQQGRIPDWADRVMPLIPEWALRRFLHWMVADPAAISPEFQTRFLRFWRRAGNRQAEMARLRQFETGRPDALLQAIRAPTLILWGRENPQLPVAMAAEFAARLKSAAVVEQRVYEHAGHLVPVECPQQSAADLLSFLRSEAVVGHRRRLAP